MDLQELLQTEQFFDYRMSSIVIKRIDNKDIQIPSKHDRFIMLYYFRATCFDSLESSSGPLMN